MKHTVIAVFDQAAEADKAARSLQDQGFDRAAVHVEPDAEQGVGQHADRDADAPVVPAAAALEGGPASGLLHRLALLFNVEEPHVAHYAEAVNRGAAVVRVDAADGLQATAARDALLALGAVNIEDRIEAWRQTGWQGATRVAAAPSAGALVHRQEVSIGGVRVYSHAAAYVFEDHVDEFRRDHAARHAGASYDEFDPAYRQGHRLATDSRYAGRSWAQIEAEARAEWEQQHPQGAWDRYKAAVRHAWERFKSG